MSENTPVELAGYLKGKKNVLLLAGDLCTKIEFDYKRLLDHVVDISRSLDAPIAATGNTPLGFKDKEVKYKKMYAAEVVNYLRRPWADDIIKERPEVLVFIGYNREVTGRLISAVKDAETVALGERYVEEATYSLPDASLGQWHRSLKGLVQAL
ncbi:MAG: hypothetical protein V2J25_13930 [Desulfatiglans sp.]|jgi:CO dehydrogenase/acetyl-CoA synthase epsilon subunit|nr:hypothetical protein [Desulfatiglans sp.]